MTRTRTTCTSRTPRTPPCRQRKCRRPALNRRRLHLAAWRGGNRQWRRQRHGDSCRGSVQRPGSRTCPGSTAAPRRRPTTASRISTAEAFRSNASGNLVAGPDRRINATGAGDNQCFGGRAAAGNAGSWLSGSRATTDSENCSQQPEVAGQCQRATTPRPALSMPAISVIQPVPRTRPASSGAGAFRSTVTTTATRVQRGGCTPPGRRARCSRRRHWACGPNQPVLCVPRRGRLADPDSRPSALPRHMRRDEQHGNRERLQQRHKRPPRGCAHIVRSAVLGVSSVVRLPRDHRAGQLLSVPGAVHADEHRATSQRH